MEKLINDNISQNKNEEEKEPDLIKNPSRN